jgi:hypothetical protein
MRCGRSDGVRGVTDLLSMGRGFPPPGLTHGSDTTPRLVGCRAASSFRPTRHQCLSTAARAAFPIRRVSLGLSGNCSLPSVFYPFIENTEVSIDTL